MENLDSDMLWALVLGVVIMVFGNGCGTERGWKFEFGVAPVAEIHDSQHLYQNRGDAK